MVPWLKYLGKREGKKAPKLEPEGGVEANRDDAEQLPIIRQLSCSPILLVEQQLSVFAVLSLLWLSQFLLSLRLSTLSMSLSSLIISFSLSQNYLSTSLSSLSVYLSSLILSISLSQTIIKS